MIQEFPKNLLLILKLSYRTEFQGRTSYILKLEDEEQRSMK